VKFGTFGYHALPPQTNAYDVVAQQFSQALAAERLGFDEVWLAEHNGRPYGFAGNSVTVAAGIAGATSRIRIGTAVTRLPVHHPLHLAEDLAYVDVMSGGRLDWGVGKGYDALEFSTYGVSFDERQERWQETFDAVRQIWATGRTEFKGQFYELADAELILAPLQRPCPPTYVMVSGSEESVRWAAERLLPVVIGSGPGWDDIRVRLEMYVEIATRAGHDPSAVAETVAQTWQLRQVHVAPTTQQAIAEYRDGLMWYMEALANRAMFGFSKDVQPYEYYVEHGSIVLGSPTKVIDELLEYNERTGIDNIICWFSLGGQPHDRVLGAMDLFAREVIPALRSAISTPVQPRTVSS
jgi:alkanesulfonate monooxygenase SsuD/methylene tetrahydromethanopterin reductase-like flavin-dependent oxidoreductase (luciferase family)